jgi:hypothetical protein
MPANNKFISELETELSNVKKGGKLSGGARTGGEPDECWMPIPKRGVVTTMQCRPRPKPGTKHNLHKVGGMTSRMQGPMAESHSLDGILTNAHQASMYGGVDNFAGMTQGAGGTDIVQWVKNVVRQQRAKNKKRGAGGPMRGAIEDWLKHALKHQNKNKKRGAGGPDMVDLMKHLAKGYMPKGPGKGERGYNKKLPIKSKDDEFKEWRDNLGQSGTFGSGVDAGLQGGFWPLVGMLASAVAPSIIGAIGKAIKGSGMHDNMMPYAVPAVLDKVGMDYMESKKGNKKKGGVRISTGVPRFPGAQIQMGQRLKKNAGEMSGYGMTMGGLESGLMGGMEDFAGAGMEDFSGSGMENFAGKGRQGYWKMFGKGRVKSAAKSAAAKKRAATNPWLKHVAQVRASNPGVQYKDILKLAKQSY